MDGPRILSVGQCGFDHDAIRRRLKQMVGAEVRRADTFPDALQSLRAESFDLVLVNRVTDEDGAPGLDLVRELKADPALATLPVMLVSNYEAAQLEAVELGAFRGFGKSDLGTGRELEALRQVFPALP